MPDSGSSGGRVLVFGASGYIGSNLVPRLMRTGRPVRASTRNRHVLEARGWPGVDTVQADALEAHTLAEALADVEVAYYLVHSMAAGSHFAGLDARAAENFGRAARQAGVRRIVYLGGLIPPDPQSTHLRSRLQTGEILRASGVPITEIRAGMVIGPGSAAFEVIRDLVNHLPLMITPRWVYSRSTPIALDNLLEYLVRVAEIPQAAGRIFDVGGAQELTYEQIMRGYGAVVGRRPRILPVPVLSPRLSSYWLRWVTTVPINIARALIDGLTQDVVADDGDIRALVPMELLNLRESVRAALAAEARGELPARWVEGSIQCRDYHPEYAFYARRVSGSVLSSAPVERLWARIASIGGDNGYYCYQPLWSLRALIDGLLGGPGLRRGRRHADDLRVGDVVDAWRVIAVQERSRLTLMMEMKAPGAGVLEFELRPQDGATRVTATAYFHPAGVWGLLYWYAMAPFHALIFRCLPRAMAARAAA